MGFGEAVTAARALLGGAAAAVEPAEDSFERLTFKRQVSSPSEIVRKAADVVAREVDVIVDWQREDADVTLRSRADGTWLVEHDLTAAFPHLAGVQAKAHWTTDELLVDDAAAAELDAADDARVRIELEKAHWTDPIAATTGRTVWIGPGAAGFAKWLAETKVEAAVRTLFGSGEGAGRAGALVLLADWPGDAVRAGERLVVGGLEADADTPADRPELIARLRDRDELDSLPRWRAIDVDAEVVEGPVHGPLTRIVGITAARLIAERDVRGRLRPSDDQATEWPPMADPPGSTPADAKAVVRLARWLADDLSQARIDAARHVAATSLADPLNGGDADRLVDTARLSYHLIVHKDVLQSLDHQQRLEESFRALDDKVQEMRFKLGDTLDATLTKVLGAALAIAIAALASPKVRDLPATLASIALAGYLVWSAVSLSKWFKHDAESRLDAMKVAAAGRVAGVGQKLDKQLATWKSELSARVRLATIVLYVLAGAFVLAGLAANGDVRRAVGIEHARVAPRLDGDARAGQRSPPG